MNEWPKCFLNKALKIDNVSEGQTMNGIASFPSFERR